MLLLRSFFFISTAKLFLLSFIALVSFSSSAQPYYFRSYQTDDGLPNNAIWASIQDSDGFMWFGTQNGLSRFDGLQFKTFPIPRKSYNSPSRDDIASLALDNAGVLWVGAGKGLFMFDKHHEQLVPFIDSLTNIRHLVFDNQRRLWFMSHETLCRYDFVKRVLVVFDRKQYFAARAICKSGDGAIWIAESGGYLKRYNEHKNSFEEFYLFHETPGESFTNMCMMHVDSEGNIYIGTQNQKIKKFNTATLTYIDLLPDRLGGQVGVIYAILATNKEELWFGTEKGLFIFNQRSNSFTKITKTNLVPYSISDDAVTALYKDREGGLWAGTYFGGVNYSPRQYYNFSKFYPDDVRGSAGGNVVREMVADKSDNIWMALEESGIAKLDPERNEIKQLRYTGKPGSIAFSNVHGLLINNNELWLGTHYHGLDVMDLRTGKIKRHYNTGKISGNFGSNFVVSFLKTTAGEIYVATSKGLLHYIAATDDFRVVQSIPSGAFVNCLIEDKNGLLWIGTGQGLYIFDPASYRTILYRDPIDTEVEKTQILALHQHHSGDIWAATEANGLWKIGNNLKSFKRFTVADGLPSNVCFKVLEDNQNNLWISTYKGLVQLQPLTNQITVFTKEDGLLNDQFNYNSGYKDAEGRLYFGSTKGLIMFDPAISQKRQVAPPLYFTGFQINNVEVAISKEGPLTQSIQFTDVIELTHDQSTFSIDFAALGYTSPERIQYSYSMAGISSEWIQLDRNRKVYFTNLNPGSYVFKIKASSFNFEGVQQRELKITILPPVWATKWAYALYVIIILSVSWYLLRSYLVLKESKRAKEMMNAKMEFFTTIAHEIKTPLTLIKGPLDNLSEMTEKLPVIKDDIKSMERNTTRLMDLAEQVLDFRQTQLKSYHLNFTETNITEILKETFEIFETIAKKRRFNYTLELPPNTIYMMADSEALQKICTNLFSNATKYAESKVHIKLELKPTEAMITIIFKNDGLIIPADMKEKIFEPFFRMEGNRTMKGSGIGLPLSRSLAELHNGKLYLRPSENDMNTFVLELPTIPIN